MFTYDEWGNYMFHIQTGREGIKMLKKAGFTNADKEYKEKHMASWRKLKAERDEQIWKQLREMFNLPEDWNKN